MEILALLSYNAATSAAPIPCKGFMLLLCGVGQVLGRVYLASQNDMGANTGKFHGSKKREVVVGEKLLGAGC